MARGTVPRGGSVVLTLTSLEPGGAEAQVTELALRLTGRGWDVVVASLTEPRSYVDRLTTGGVEVVSLGMQRGVADPRGALRLAALLRRRRPSILHGHMFHANILTRIVGCLRREMPVVNTIHSVLEGGRERDAAYRATRRLADITTAVSRAAANRYLGAGVFSPGELIVVPNGIDVARHVQDPVRRREVRADLRVGDRFVWVSAGRLDPAKDHRTMLASMAHLCQGLEGTPPALIIAGGGPLKQKLRRAIAEFALEGVVRLLGHRDDVPDLLRAADGFVMTSTVEGLPMALLEAAASGLPVVTTDVGGTSEIVLNGLSGIVVQPGDVVGLSEALRFVMDASPRERRRMGEMARTHVQATYDLADVTDRWIALYENLIQKRARPTSP